MANILYYGKIGDGKTYHVVANEILPAIKTGRRVYTNIEGLDHRELAFYAGIPLADVKITQWETSDEIRAHLVAEKDDKEGASLKIEKGSLVAIDEAQLVYDAREFKNTGKSFLTLLEKHRHWGLDIVFITQNPKRLEGAICRLANRCYQVKNLGFLSTVFGSRYVIHHRQTPFDDVVQTSHGRLKPEIFKLYKSAVLHGDKTHKTKSALTGGLMWLLLLCIAISGSSIIKHGGLAFMNPKVMGKKNDVGSNRNNVSTGSEAVPVGKGESGTGLVAGADPAAAPLPGSLDPKNLGSASKSLLNAYIDERLSLDPRAPLTGECKISYQPSSWSFTDKNGTTKGERILKRVICVDAANRAPGPGPGLPAPGASGA
jgi:zona occludens toxin (predicted ATPase)